MVTVRFARRAGCTRHKCLSYATRACAVAVCIEGSAVATPGYCPAATPFYAEPRMALWNSCYDPESTHDEYEQDASNWSPDERTPLGRVASFERILSVATIDVDVSGDRVAAAERGGAVWVLTDRAKTRLAAPRLVEAGTSPIEIFVNSFTPRFDAKDGSLVLFGFGSTVFCGIGSEEGEMWKWRWRERWVPELHSYEPSKTDRMSREPKAPVPELADLWSESDTKRQDGTGRFWRAGPVGSYVYDHAKWWQVADAPSSVHSMAAQGKDRVWISSAYGLYRGLLLPTITPVDLPRRAPILETGPHPSPMVGMPLAETELANLTVQRVSLKVQGAAPLTSASWVMASPDQTLHFVDRKRIVVLDKGIATSYSQAASAAQPLAFAKGDSWLLSKSDIVRVHLSKVSATRPVAFSPNALAMTDDAGWLATCREADANPTAMKWNGTNWSDVPEFPRACYNSVALAGRDSAWMVGGLRTTKSWPTGAGILVHATGNSLQAYRVPEGALLSVAALSPDEIYAGGYDGLLVHRRGSAQTALRVHGDPWILALATKGDIVAIVGEGLVGVLKGGQLFRVPARLLPAGTWQSAAFDSTGSLWVVGDPGILQISLRLR